MNPSHKNPSGEHTASAPYNFITLSDKVVKVSSDELPERHQWDVGRLSGVVECSLCTESPLYVGGSDQENADFFHHGDSEQPVIPGSSLRGMLRTLVEIITFSKLQPISEKKLFYRDINDTRGYQSKFVKLVGQSFTGPLKGANVYAPLVKAGILHIDAQRGYRIELCEMARVDHDILSRDLGTPNRKAGGPFDGHRNRKFPKPAFQGISVTVDVDPEADHPFPAQFRENGKKRHGDMYLRFREVTAISKDPTKPLSQSGILVLTGHMQHKHLEFVFQPTGRYHGDPDNLLDGIVERVEDDDQITEWQEKVFPKELNNRPTGRRRNGGLRAGEPIFYLEDDRGRLVFIGRAQLFRLPFGYPPSELRYAPHKEATALDVAEAIFGFVDKPKAGDKTKMVAVAGRVFVTDAFLSEKPVGSVWLDPDRAVFTTKVLATPKPSAYAHYLVQENPDVMPRINLSTHRQEKAVIRGHKLYWHQTKSDGTNAVPLTADDLRATPNPNNPEQFPHIKPIRPGLRFSFRAHFEQLTDAELGALLWAIVLPSPKTSELRHKLGMGKSLGMGSVKVTVDRLQVLEPEARCSSFVIASPEGEDSVTEGEATPTREEIPTGDDPSAAKASFWATGLREAQWETYIDAFKSWMEGQLNLAGGDFDKQDRIRELRLMLRWPGLTPVSYMSLDDHKQRPVLPGPQAVFDAGKMRQKPLSACAEEPVVMADMPSESGKTGAASRVPDLPAGSRIRAMVIDITNQGVFLELIGLPEAYQDYAGLIPTEALQGRRYTLDHPARVIVEEVDHQAMQVRCRPQP